MIHEDTDEGSVREIAMSRVGVMVRDSLVSSLKGIGEIEAEIVSRVRHRVAKHLRNVGLTSAEKSNVLHVIMTNVLRAALESDTGVAFSLKSVVKGMVLGVTDACGDVQAASHIVALAAAEATKIGADVVVVTRQAVQGVMEASNETGRHTESLTQLTLAGALETSLTNHHDAFLPQEMYRENSKRGAAVWPARYTL
jgi:hypothetical protein